MNEIPNALPNNELPEKIKNSIYVHPFINDTDDIPKMLIDALPSGFSFLRLSSTHSHLTFVTKLTEQQNNGLKHRKHTMPVFSGIVSENLFVAIFYKTDSVFPNLPAFAKTHQNLVLNFVPELVHDNKNSDNRDNENPEKTEETLEKNTLIELKNKINQYNLLNHKDFYAEYINKEDKFEFPAVSKIKFLKDNIYALILKNNIIALISKTLLLAAKNYNPSNQFSISASINHTFHPPEETSKKRKAGENDLNKTSSKQAKSEEKPESEKKIESKENSTTERNSSAGKHAEEQDANTAAGYGNS